MSDRNFMTDEQLHLATSHSLPADVPLDADTAAARDAFVALGTALEAAGNSLDEEALIASLRRSCLGDEPKAILPGHMARSRSIWPALAAGVLAATVLLVIVFRGLTRPQGGDVVQAQSVQHLTPDARHEASAQSVLPPEDTSGRAAFASWDDSLDDQLAVAALSIRQFASGNRGFDSSIVDMNDRLEALSQELYRESL